MEWLKNEKEIFQFLNDMEKNNKVANLDNYIKWIKDSPVQLKQKKEVENLNIKISVSDKQNKILIY